MKTSLYFLGLGLVWGCGPSSLTAAKLETAMDSCGKAMGGAEGENISCASALPYIKRALNQYKLTTPEQMAYYISVMSVESVNLSYNKNHSPGRPGQGTRSMMMPNNLHAFLKDSPRILKAHPELRGIANSPYDDSNHAAKETVLQVLMKNEYAFLPGAWWIAKGGETQMKPQCSNFKATLAKPIAPGVVDDLNAKCLGVGMDPARTMAYQKAYNAVVAC